MDIYGHICAYLKEGKMGRLATVVRAEGSASQGGGEKMFVGEDGATFGTVVGGPLEADVCRRALDIMGNGRTSVFSLSIDLMEGVACGGTVEILLEPVTIKHLGLYRKIDALAKEGRRGVVVTKFGKNVFTKSVLADDMTVAGDPVGGPILDWCRNLVYEKRPVLIGGMLAEPLRESFPLYLFGSGEVAQSVSRIAKMADFSITVIDDTDRFANREAFPDAGNIVCCKFRDAFKSLPFTGNEYVVVATRSREADARVLEESLGRPTKYVGMIGSAKKIKAVLDRLRRKGISEALIGQVHAPLGIPIHAETPQELAISIVAELVTIRNGASSDEERTGMMAG